MNTKQMKRSLMNSFLFAVTIVLLPLSIQAQVLSKNDSIKIYHKIIFNFQSYFCQKIIYSELNNIRQGDLSIISDNPALTDTGEYFPVNMHIQSTINGDTNSLIISFYLETQTTSKEWIRPMSVQHYSPLMNRGIIIYDKKYGNIKYVSGYFFLHNSLFFFDKIKEKYSSKSEAIKEYISLRLYNFIPVNIVSKDNIVSFYSKALNRDISFTLNEVHEGAWQWLQE